MLSPLPPRRPKPPRKVPFDHGPGQCDGGSGPRLHVSNRRRSHPQRSRQARGGGPRRERIFAGRGGGRALCPARARARDWPVSDRGEINAAFFDYFEGKYVVSPTGCWLWTRGRFTKGYGCTALKVEGKFKMLRAHRHAWTLAYGPIQVRPQGEPPLFVCHKCDVRHCVNPEHLFLGTVTDNVRDMENKGRARHPKGKENGYFTQPGRRGIGGKLTAHDVVGIRLFWSATDYSQRHIACLFGINQSTVCEIVNRDIWSHVP